MRFMELDMKWKAEACWPVLRRGKVVGVGNVSARPENTHTRARVSLFSPEVHQPKVVVHDPVERVDGEGAL